MDILNGDTRSPALGLPRRGNVNSGAYGHWEYPRVKFTSMSTAHHLPSHSYEQVPPAKLSNFPRSLGESEDWAPGNITLSVRQGTGDLELVSDPPYDSSRHASRGIAPGKFSFEQAIRTGTGWSGGITRYLQSGKPCEWKTKEPAKGVFELAADVSSGNADAVRGFEREHIDDFQFAWDNSFGLVESLLPGIPASSTKETIKALVTRLIDAGATYLIPADPDDLNNWGPRILGVYRQLCAHSYRRDDRGHHSPLRFEFTVTGKSIYVSFVPGPNYPSKDYVVPGDIPRVFTAASYEEYVQRGNTAGSAPPAGLPVSTEVVWSDYAVGNRWEKPPTGLEQGEQVLHAVPFAAPDAPFAAEDGGGPANYPLSTSGGTVVGQDGEYVWVKVCLRDPDNPNWADELPEKVKELDLRGGNVYLRLRSLMLKPKPET